MDFVNIVFFFLSGLSGDGVMSPDGKLKLDIKDDGGNNNEPHKPKVPSFSTLLIVAQHIKWMIMFMPVFVSVSKISHKPLEEF